MILRPTLAAACLIAGCAPLCAGIPLQINHQGVVSVNGAPFTGTGLFRFALIDPISGLNLWTNDGSTDGTPGMPTSAVEIPVVNGLYSVRLGDATLTNMVPLPSAVFDSDSVRLRVWFDDGVSGVLQLAPDHPLTSVPYAFHAGVADTSVNALSAAYAESAGTASAAATATHAETAGIAGVATTALNAGIPPGSLILGSNPTPPSGYSSSGLRLFSNDGAWTRRRNIDFPLAAPGSTVLNGRLHVVGGIDAGDERPYHQVYDPVTDMWSQLGPLPVAKADPGAATVDGKVYVMGGRESLGTPQVFDHNEVYDASMDVWLPLAPMPTARWRLAMVPLEGKIHAIGGLTLFAATDAHEVYDTVTNAWSKAAPIPVVHDGTAGVAVNDKIYAFQGDRTFEYDPGTNMWAERAKMSNIARWSYGAVALDDRIFVIGGLLAGSSNAVDICEEYDPVADRWHTRPSILNARGLLALGAINGRIYVATGYDFLGVGYPPSTEEFTPPTSYFLYSKD